MLERSDEVVKLSGNFSIGHEIGSNQSDFDNNKINLNTVEYRAYPIHKIKITL